MRYLEALEEDRFDVFLVESHIRNFIMTYARTVQIDEDIPLDLFEAMMTEEREREKGEQMREEQIRRNQRKRRLLILAGAALVLLMVVFALSTRLIDFSTESGVAGPAEPASGKVSEPPPSSSVTEAPAVQPTPPIPPAPVETTVVVAAEAVESPLTVIGRVLISGHGLSSWDREYWWTYSWVRIAGISHPEELTALSYLTPDGKLVELEPELSESGAFNGRFVYSDRNLESPPLVGDYRFVLVDSNGLEKRFSLRLSRVMSNLPSLIHPVSNQQIFPEDLEITWEGVPAASSYTIHVKTMQNERLWVRNGITETSLLYNDDGKARVEILPPAKYILSVYAQDSRGNMSVRHINFEIVS
jgi:hypothetical protein